MNPVRSQTASPIRHLYLHVPFCASKCRYCAFYSRPGSTEEMAAYVDAVLTELTRCGLKVEPVTISLGGGTPSLLPVPATRRLLEGLAARIPCAAVREWTIEANPATVSADKARLYRESGINRISLGVQALDDSLLRILGRIHATREALDTFADLRAAGFTNLNLDLMFGLPGQTVDQFACTLRQVVDLQPEHVSTYALTLEEDTEFWSWSQQGRLRPNDELELRMYELAIETLTAAGYHHYEISNFARPGFECAHNLAYWEGADYLGLGPGACSTVGLRRWQNMADITRYVNALREGRRPVESHEALPPALREGERAAFGLRMLDGVPAEWLEGRWAGEVARLTADGLLLRQEGRLRLTRQGLRFADSVAAEFV